MMRADRLLTAGAVSGHSPLRRGWAWLIGLLLLPALAQAQVSASDDISSIFVYAGWKVFHENCHSCHGTDAVGTDIAPNLVERINTMTPEAFATKVLTRYRIVLKSSEMSGDDRTALREALMHEVREHERGQAGELIMPAWESKNPDVKPHLLDLYDYLQARASGRLGEGVPPLP